MLVVFGVGSKKYQWKAMNISVSILRTNMFGIRGITEFHFGELKNDGDLQCK